MPAQVIKTKRIGLKPGEYCVSDKDVIISTLLGSCVAACLYDPVGRVVGMNHFLLSEKKHDNKLPICVTDAGRYGVYAMELLINDMLKKGAKRKNLRAKAFGGSMVLGPSGKKDNGFLNVAEMNVRFIQEFLKNDGIPLVSFDMGGDQGRVIYFCSDDFSVYVRKIRKNAGLIRRERDYWKKDLESHEKTAYRPDIWLD